MITDAREPDTELPAWPPYLMAAVAFVSAIVLSAAVVIPYVFLRVWEPGLSIAQLLKRVTATNPMTADVLLLSTTITAAVLTALTLAAAARPRGDLGRWSMFRRRLRLTSTTIPDAFAASVGVLGLGLLLDAVVHLVGLHDEGSLAAIRAALGVLSTPELVVAAVVIGVFPGIGEELFFRGYLLRRIERVEGVIPALITSSIIFGVFHFDLVHTPTSAMVGFYLGVMVLWSGSLWTGIVAHTVNNFAAAITVGIQQHEDTAWLVMLIGLNAAGCGLWYAWRRHGKIAGRPFW